MELWCHGVVVHPLEGTTPTAAGLSHYNQCTSGELECGISGMFVCGLDCGISGMFVCELDCGIVVCLSVS